MRNEFNKQQTRQQLNDLTEQQLADIGKNHQQISEELLKSAFRYSLKNVISVPLKEGLVGKMNDILRSVK
jgi:hypothetical protein